MFDDQQLRLKTPFSLVLMAIALAACGGGGGGGDSGSSAPVVPPNSAPTLIGNLSPSFSENTDVSFFLDVADADGDTVTITVGNSSDGQFFTLDTATGEIRSTQAFDFETPLDENGDNVYEQTVTLDDGSVTVDRLVRVIITNIDEAPSCDSQPDTSVNENFVGSLLVFTGTDPDAGDAANAVFSTLSVSDATLDGQFSLNSATGELSLDVPLDAEAYPDNFSVTVTATYQTNSLSDQCLVNLTLIDLPARVRSGILFEEARSSVQQLDDLDGDGLAEFWLADDPDPSSDEPATGVLVFGQTLASTRAGVGDGTIAVAQLSASQGLRIRTDFSLGLGSAKEVDVRSISDLDGDGVNDLLIATAQPPNDGLDPTRRPWGYIVYATAITENVGGILTLNTLAQSDGFSLSGPVDFNGSQASYSVANLDGTTGDEIAIALPDALGTGSETGRLYIIDGVALAGASGNFDFDLDASTQTFEGSLDPDPQLTIGALSVIGDLEGDGNPELLMQSGRAAAIIPSATLAGAGSGSIESLAPSLIDLDGDFVGALSQGDVDGDLLPDLLLVRGDGSPDSKQAAIVFGDALAAIVSGGNSVTLDSTDLNVGDFIDLTSRGLGSGPQPIRLASLGDLDGDGADEVAFSLLDNADFAPGSIYILRGSELNNDSGFTFSVDGFTGTQGTQLTGIPAEFSTLSTQLSLAPDLDGDGVSDFYLTSFVRDSSDPQSQAVLVLSSEIVTALNANEVRVDLKDLFFDETLDMP